MVSADLGRVAPVRVLILGGTAEGRSLAAGLHGRQGFDVVSSLAGRTAVPAAAVGETRVGGFGGAEGLARHLRDEAVDVLVDTTHPFAATVSRHAAAAAEATGTRLIALRRPAWTPGPGDRWIRVADVAEAVGRAAALDTPGTVFVTTGRQEVGLYSTDERHEYLIRTVEQPTVALPPRHTLLLDRGPYTVDGEGALMDRHAVCAVVTKNSGGTLTAAKLVAARLREIPVIMVDRPVLPAVGETAGDVSEVLALLTGEA